MNTPTSEIFAEKKVRNCACNPRQLGPEASVLSNALCCPLHPQEKKTTWPEFYVKKLDLDLLLLSFSHLSLFLQQENQINRSTTFQSIMTAMTASFSRKKQQYVFFCCPAPHNQGLVTHLKILEEDLAAFQFDTISIWDNLIWRLY